MSLTWRYTLRDGDQIYKEGDCLSTDTKPTTDTTLKNGSKLIELDTATVYMYDKDNTRWLPWGDNARVITAAVNAWLTAHPEATTTVQDGSLTEAKFSDALALKAIKDYVTPQMYGAKGDGVTDDTDAIQAMLTANTVRKAMYFQRGTYIVSDTLIIPQTAKSNLYYSDGDAIISCQHNGDGIYFNSDDSEAGMCRFQNLIINGPNPAFGEMSAKTSTGAGLRLSHAYHNIFDHCYITGFKYGTKLETGIGNAFINDTYFRFNEYGVYLSGNATNANRWTNCSIRQNWVAGVCIDGTGTTELPMFNSFETCLIESNKPYVAGDISASNGFGVWLKRTAHNFFNGCYFENHRRSFYFSDSALTSKILACRFVNNTGSLFEFDGSSVNANTILYCTMDGSSEYDSIVITQSNTGLVTNRFVGCDGFNYSSRNSATNYPTIEDGIKNSSFGGDYCSKLQVGAAFKNVYMTEHTDGSPWFGNGTLHTAGYGELQFGSLVTADIEITAFDGLRAGDVLILNNYQTGHKVTIKNASVTGSGSVDLQNNKDVVLDEYNETIVLYKNLNNQIVEITRNFTLNKGDGQVVVTKTDSVSTSSSAAYMKGEVLKISVDVTLSAASSGWVNILTISTNKTLLSGGYGVATNMSDGLCKVLQVFDDSGTITLRIQSPAAVQYRGEIIALLQ